MKVLEYFFVVKNYIKLRVKKHTKKPTLLKNPYYLMISLACVKNFRSSLAWLILNCPYVIFLAIREVRKP